MAELSREPFALSLRLKQKCSAVEAIFESQVPILMSSQARMKQLVENQGACTRILTSEI